MDSHERWIAEVVSPTGDDHVPALNGVRVGQVFRNIHTGGLSSVRSIRLAGHGTYRGHQPTVMLVDVGMDEPAYWPMASPLWSLAEHWDLVAESVEDLEELQLAIDGSLPVLPHPCPYRHDSRFGREGRHGLHRDDDVCQSVRRGREKWAEQDRQLTLDVAA